MATPNVYQKSPIIKEIKVGKYWWCACGISNNQPFCDGSHKNTEFSPMEIEIKNDSKVAWCGCKHTNKKPFCDGTHKNL